MKRLWRNTTPARPELKAASEVFHAGVQEENWPSGVDEPLDVTTRRWRNLWRVLSEQETLWKEEGRSLLQAVLEKEEGETSAATDWWTHIGKLSSAPNRVYVSERLLDTCPESAAAPVAAKAPPCLSELPTPALTGSNVTNLPSRSPRAAKYDSYFANLVSAPYPLSFAASRCRATTDSLANRDTSSAMLVPPLTSNLGGIGPLAPTFQYCPRPMDILATPVRAASTAPLSLDCSQMASTGDNPVISYLLTQPRREHSLRSPSVGAEEAPHASRTAGCHGRSLADGALDPSIAPGAKISISVEEIDDLVANAVRERVVEATIAINRLENAVDSLFTQLYGAPGGALPTPAREPLLTTGLPYQVGPNQYDVGAARVTGGWNGQSGYPSSWPFSDGTLPNFHGHSPPMNMPLDVRTFPYRSVGPGAFIPDVAANLVQRQQSGDELTSNYDGALLANPLPAASQADATISHSFQGNGHLKRSAAASTDAYPDEQGVKRARADIAGNSMR